jgi:predicted nucleotidyltransferase
MQRRPWSRRAPPGYTAGHVRVVRDGDHAEQAAVPRLGGERRAPGNGGAPARGEGHAHGVDDPEFCTWLTGELAGLTGVLAVSLGGSRAHGRHQPDSDWDFAVYYRGGFDPGGLRAKGWDGQVSEVGGWGGGVMNGGAWLSIDGRRVDVHYRDLNEVEHWCAEARKGRFGKELLPFYAAGIPTYVVMGELAMNSVLAGELPTPEYPEALAAAASARWHADSLASLSYGRAALRSWADTTVGLVNAARGLIEAAHGLLAARKTWVLNEKGIVERAGLDSEAGWLVSASDASELDHAITAMIEARRPGAGAIS